MNQHSAQEAIITLLNRIYADVVGIEERFGLIVGGGDIRPRIDYFHDAIRAFTSPDAKIRETRLSVEMLAYDLRCLRYIQQMPLAPFRKDGENLAPTTAVVNAGEGLVAAANRPDRETRLRLVELYQNYAVMFAALLKPAADSDYLARTEALDEDVKDILAIIHQFETHLFETMADINIIAHRTQQLEEAELRFILTTFLHQQKHKNKDDVQKLIAHLKEHIRKKDKKIKDVDKAHGDFAMAQLGIFEESKDMLKKLAAQGMNVVGKFVENAISDTRRQMGGKGM